MNEACRSEHHRRPVPATVRGDVANRWNPDRNERGVAYCDACASAAEAFGMFTPRRPIRSAAATTEAGR